MKHCYMIAKSLFILFLLLCTVAESFAGDGSKDSPYSFQEYMSLVKSSNSDVANNKWINCYMGIYKAYSTVISSGGMKTEEQTKLILTDKPGVIYSSRQPSQYTTNSFVMVYGDDFLEDNPSVSNALNNNTSMKMLAHCSSHWKHAQGYYVVDVDKYEIGETNEIFGTCGDKLTWTFLEETKTLTISGIGEMWNYDFRDGISTPWKDFRQEIKTVLLEDGVTTIGSDAFNGCVNMDNIEIPNSIVSIGSCAFWQCSSLTSISIPNAVTTIWGALFYECVSLKNVIIPQEVTTIEESAFYGCKSLASIIIPSNVQSIEDNTFNGCLSLTSIVIGMGVKSLGQNAVRSCESLRDIYCYSSNVPSTASNTFSNSNLQYISVHVPANLTDSYKSTSPWSGFKEIVALTDNDPKPTDNPQFDEREAYAVLSEASTKLTFYYDKYKEFRGGISIVPIYDEERLFYKPSWFDKSSEIRTVIFEDSFAAYTNVTSTASWFWGCDNLVEILGLRNLNTENVKDMTLMFAGCEKLETIDVSKFNTQNVENMSNMFAGCRSLTMLNLSGFNTERVIDMSGMFSDCVYLNNLNIRGFNTSKVENMSGMFSRCSKLSNIDVSGFNTSNVTSMSGLFSDCSGLKSIDVSGFNTSNVTTMASVFSGCSSLLNIDLSGFNTSKVDNMAGMFSGCSSLTNIDVSGFNTSNATNMNGMFSECYGLKNIDVSRFDTSKVKSMFEMFAKCGCITSLDLSSFKTANLATMVRMFWQCTNLTTIYVSEGWSTDMISTADDGFSSFFQCYKLVGGQGTKYDSSHTDYIYARIDGGTASPGYFTYKENTGVNGVCIDDASVVENFFDVNGHAHDGYVKGLNIVRMSNGTTMKVVVK